LKHNFRDTEMVGHGTVGRGCRGPLAPIVKAAVDKAAERGRMCLEGDGRG